MGSDNDWGVPLIKKYDGEIPDDFSSFHQIVRYHDSGVHCFIEDYYLERLWKRPEYYSTYLLRSKLFISPDFSLFTDMPLSMQLWNTYRSRYVGAYMQKLGVNVIPSIGWASDDSFDFCFLGVEQSSTVAISTVGCNNREKFTSGLNAMIGTIHPEKIVWFGERYTDIMSSISTQTIHIKNKRIEKLRNNE